MGILTGHNYGNLIQIYTSGTVSSTTGPNNAGGVAGQNDGKISLSHSSASVYGSGIALAAAGLVGRQISGSITDSYATGPISGPGGSGSAFGGLVGENDNGKVTTSYSTGAVSSSSGSTLIGGLFGINTGTVTNSYWDKNTSGLSTSPSGTGLADVQLTSGTLPTGFSSSIWYPVTGHIPYLSWEAAVSGNVYNGTSPIVAATVDELLGGSLLGVTTTNANGFYVFEAAGAIPQGQGVLTYVAAENGSTFSDGGNSNSYTGMNIYTNRVTLQNSRNTIYSDLLTAVASAIGSNNPGNFSLSGNLLTLAPATNLAIQNSGASFSIDAPINVSANTLTLGGMATSVTQTAPISASSLALAGGSNYSLTNSGNSFGVLAANVNGNLSIFDSSALTVGIAGGVAGVAAGGTVLLNSISDLTIVENSAATNRCSVCGQGSGDAVVLVTGGKFTNNQDNLVGNTALSVYGGGGRWLVYSRNPANDNRGGLAFGFKQYNATYSVTTPLDTTDNGFLYTLAPAINTSLTGSTSKTYNGTNAATLTAANYTSTGAVDGDTVTLTNFPTADTYSDANAASGKTVTANGLPTTSVTSAGEVSVYGYQFAASSPLGNIGTINPAQLTYTANTADRTYGGSNPFFSGVVSGFVSSDTLANATTGTRAFSTSATPASNVGNYAIDGGGLTANNGNYTFAQAESNPSALSINPAQLAYTASAANRTYGSANPALAGIVTGFVNNDTLNSATTGTLAFSTPATPASNVGDYAIDGSGLIDLGIVAHDLGTAKGKIVVGGLEVIADGNGLGERAGATQRFVVARADTPALADQAEVLANVRNAAVIVAADGDGIASVDGHAPGQHLAVESGASRFTGTARRTREEVIAGSATVAEAVEVPS